MGEQGRWRAHAGRRCGTQSGPSDTRHHNRTCTGACAHFNATAFTRASSRSRAPRTRPSHLRASGPAAALTPVDRGTRATPARATHPRGETAALVRGQCYIHDIVRVAPFRMVVHLARRREGEATRQPQSPRQGRRTQAAPTFSASSALCVMNENASLKSLNMYLRAMASRPDTCLPSRCFSLRGGGSGHPAIAAAAPAHHLPVRQRHGQVLPRLRRQFLCRRRR